MSRSLRLLPILLVIRPPAVAIAAGGDFVVAWAARGNGVYARLYRP